jgi:hypothetical protein
MSLGVFRRLAVLFATVIVSACGTAPPGKSHGVDTITVGRIALDPAAFRTYSDTIDDYIVRGEVRERTGTWYSSLQASTPEMGGDYVFQVTLPGTEGTVVSSTVVRGETMEPLTYRNQAPQDSAEIRFNSQRAVGWAVPMSEDLRRVDVPFVEGMRPFAGAGAVMTGLPLAEGYVAMILVFGAYSGELGWKKVEVTASDTMTYRGQVVDSWVVQESDPSTPNRPNRRYWISKNGRHVLKSQGGFSPAGGERWWFVR